MVQAVGSVAGPEAEASSLPVASLCEAFQRTAAAQPRGIALRTPGGAVEISWADDAGRVQRIAAGLAALGLEHGETLGLMLTNRPEFNLVETAAIHLGASPFSIYNTSAPEQIASLLSNASRRRESMIRPSSPRS